jgi:hypothetical protein
MTGSRYDRNRRIPSFVTRLLMRLSARRSPLLRKILTSDKEYLDSISTYMLKLGADHLPPGFDGPIDRKVAASPHMALVRRRMQQIARLLAKALLSRVADAPDAPLHLINIAGGPALDSINALIMLRLGDGLDVQFQHHAYDWNDTAPLARPLAGLAERRAIIAASSEGGLFEYGTDDAV